MRVALESVARAAVVALKVVEVALAATVADAGVVRAALVSVMVRAAPPAGAALVRVTVQVLELFGPRLAGLHEIDETPTDATRLIVVLAEVLL